MGTPNQCLSSCISPFKILFVSLRILLHNKILFSSILILTTLPLSFLFFTLTISTHTLCYPIYHLQALAHAVSTRVESDHVLEESLSLIRTRGLFSLLCFPLSLAAAVVSSVHATISSFNGKHASVSSAAAAAVELHNYRREANGFEEICRDFRGSRSFLCSFVQESQHPNTFKSIRRGRIRA